MRAIYPEYPASIESARKSEQIGSGDWADMAFPLTPALSLRERENRRQRVVKSAAPGIFGRRTTCLPLPEGEGRGEGERSSLLANSLSLTDCACRCSVLLAALCALAALCGCGPPAAQAPPKVAAPVTVQTVLPKRGEIARSITLPSFRILAYQEATLYAKVTGYLKTLTVDKGDAVKEGQLLAEIEVPELLSDEVQFKAETAVSRTNYERMAEARKKAPDLVIPQTVDDLRGQWEVAQAKLQRTQTLLQYGRIVAPFTGVITARFVDPGVFIAAATAGSTPQSAAILTLMDYTRVRIQIFVPEPEVPFIKNGLPVLVTVEELPGRSFPGTVTRFAHALDETTKTMLTEIEMPNPSGELRPGAYASVRLEVERKLEALLLPVQTLAVEKAGTFVFAVADGKAKKTPVRIGFNDGVNVEVTDLEPNQRVILVGKQPLTDGQPVNAVEAK
jgi:membrane fusion protein, multidrug efflux system